MLSIGVVQILRRHNFGDILTPPILCVNSLSLLSCVEICQNPPSLSTVFVDCVEPTCIITLCHSLEVSLESLHRDNPSLGVAIYICNFWGLHKQTNKQKLWSNYIQIQTFKSVWPSTIHPKPAIPIICESAIARPKTCICRKITICL